MTDPQQLLRGLPKVDRLMGGELEELCAAYPRRQVLSELRRLLDDLRRRIAEEGASADDISVEAIRARLGERLAESSRTYYRRVINATGVILHTGLGRAPLAPEAVAALAELSGQPQRVEIDLASGERGGRDRGCADLLRELTGCEDATVVNNNAAATLVLLAALARGKGVIVSRGELVEIGGSYRVPEIMAESGARLTEVGTTNRTHLRDYEGAIDDDTGLILKVHTSNYRVVGFTAEVDVRALVEVGRERGVPVVYDLGSGSMVDLAATGHIADPSVPELIAAGVDLVCFSGDKLLGGPQAGLIAGRAAPVEACRRHPLFRAMRPGRLVYSALEATLRLYLGGDEHAIERVPALRRLARDADELEREAGAWAAQLADIPGLEAEAVACFSQAGSGSLPTHDLPSWGVAVAPAWCSVAALAAELRRGEPAILARAQDDALLFDLRTVESDDRAAIGARLRHLAERSA